MASEKRIIRLQVRIREELAQIIDREMDFKPGVLVTVTRAEVSEDLFAGRIYVSVFPAQEGGDVMKMLEKNIYDIQQFFNKRMGIRPVPRLRFILDTSVKEADEIERSLYELKQKS